VSTPRRPPQEMGAHPDRLVGHVPNRKPTRDQLETFKRAIQHSFAKLEGANWPTLSKDEKAVQQSFAEGRQAINADSGLGGARDSLRFLARKVKQPAEALLEDFILILWPFSNPPARARLSEINRVNQFAKGLRDTAAILREDPVCGFWADQGPSWYSPRCGKRSLIIPQRPAFHLLPEADRLPEMLERYASFLENKARRLRYYARQEPTENQYWKDCVDKVVTYVKSLTGKFYRDKVTTILRILRPSIAVEAETLRKRTYRQTKSRPA
jgi:hypothetical protein